MEGKAADLALLHAQVRMLVLHADDMAAAPVANDLNCKNPMCIHTVCPLSGGDACHYLVPCAGVYNDDKRNNEWRQRLIP